MKAIISKEIYGRSPIDFTDKCYVVIGMRIVRIEYNIIGNLIWEKRVLVFGIPVYHSKIFRIGERPRSFSRQQ